MGIKSMPSGGQLDLLEPLAARTREQLSSFFQQLQPVGYRGLREKQRLRRL